MSKIITAAMQWIKSPAERKAEINYSYLLLAFCYHNNDHLSSIIKDPNFNSILQWCLAEAAKLDHELSCKKNKKFRSFGFNSPKDSIKHNDAAGSSQNKAQEQKNEVDIDLQISLVKFFKYLLEQDQDLLKESQNIIKDFSFICLDALLIQLKNLKKDKENEKITKKRKKNKRKTEPAFKPWTP